MKTADEFAKEYLNKLSRKEKIKRIVDEVDSWDIETLVYYAKDRTEQELNSLGDSSINDEFATSFEYEIDQYVSDALFDQDGEDKEDELKPECDCDNLFSMGHDSPNCPFTKK